MLMKGKKRPNQEEYWQCKPEVSGAVGVQILKCSGFRMGVEKDAAAQELQCDCAIVVTICSCIIFSFPELHPSSFCICFSCHTCSAIALKMSVLSETLGWLNFVLWVSQLYWDFFRRFLSELRIVKWCSSYKGPSDDMYAESAHL